VNSNSLLKLRLAASAASEDHKPLVFRSLSVQQDHERHRRLVERGQIAFEHALRDFIAAVIEAERIAQEIFKCPRRIPKRRAPPRRAK
jgi:hypothetical protein